MALAFTRNQDRTKDVVAAATAVAEAATTIIDLKGVVKTYSSGGTHVQALRGVSLEVPRGEIVGIMGQSGCGKTTLLNCMSGLDVIDAGVVKIAGTDLASMNDRQKTTYRAHNMGFIFQTYNLLPVLSAVENVELPLVVSGVNTGQARERAIAALERVGLVDKANQRPSQLRAVSASASLIARSLVNDPAIVWADEPTGALDSRTANDIITLMEELNRDHGQDLRHRHARRRRRQALPPDHSHERRPDRR
jgi:putative ABC transport system ATP-binding protein